MVAYETARWVAFAFHDPKNMPTFSLSTVERPKENTEINDAKVRGWFIAMSMRKH